VYNRRTKIFFGFMVLVMGIGYPLSLLAGTSVFSSLLGGGNNATQSEKLVNDARKDVRSNHCDVVAEAPTKATRKRKEACVESLRKLGGAYLTLAAPATNSDGTQGDPPADANDSIDKAIDAFKLWTKIDPTDDDGATSLGAAYIQRQEPKLALPIFAKLAKDNPGDPDLAYRWATVAQQAGDSKTAIAAYRAYIKEYPDDANVDLAKEQLKTLLNPPKAGAAGAGGLPAGVTAGQ
jgi:tetratricopeptide (TPR) repeat protein